MIRSDAVSGLLFALLGGLAASKARTFGLGTLAEPGAGFFPFWGGILILVCALAILVQAILRARAGWRSDVIRVAVNWPKIWLCVGALFAYAVALPWVGFGVSTFLFMLVLSRLDPRTTWAAGFAIAWLGALGFWLMFVRLLSVSFPPPAMGF